jgi:rare lipoprotein A
MNRYRYTALLAAILSLAMASACRHKRRAAKTAHPPRPRETAVSIGTTEEGLASWYGVPYHGRPAADGEIYDMEQLVAAHRTMPFNTWLKVTNLKNGRSVNVRVIDRGPFVDGRIIDLSKAAARQVEMIGPGVARVRLEVISAPVDTPATDYYGVQIGAFTNHSSAEKLRARFSARLGTAQIAVKQGRTPLYRVLVGRERSQADAQKLAGALASEFPQVFVVRLDPETPGNALNRQVNVPGRVPNQSAGDSSAGPGAISRTDREPNGVTSGLPDDSEAVSPR